MDSPGSRSEAFLNTSRAASVNRPATAWKCQLLGSPGGVAFKKLMSDSVSSSKEMAKKSLWGCSFSRSMELEKFSGPNVGPLPGRSDDSSKAVDSLLRNLWMAAQKNLRPEWYFLRKTKNMTPIKNDPIIASITVPKMLSVGCGCGDSVVIGSIGEGVVYESQCQRAQRMPL